MANFYEDNDDLRFYVEKGIDWKTIIELMEKPPEGAKDDWWQETLGNYKDVLELSGQFAADEIAPRAAAMDKQGLHMVDGKVQYSKEHDAIFDNLAEMGMFGLCIPTELGGMNAPNLMYMLVGEMFARGDVSVMTHYGFHTGTMATLLHYSLKEGSTKLDDDGAIVETRFAAEIADMLSGNTCGAMDLTEPGAGSDLSAIRTTGKLDDDNVWRVTGNKIFITSGTGNYHLVLAKTSDEASLGALSLFLVPLELKRDGDTITNAVVDRIEEKIGHHASATCSIQFENSEGQLIGKPGDGFKLMLMLMNHARLSVGVESIGLAEAAYRAAKEYAAERVSMGVTIDKHPMIADYLDELEVTLQGLRALAIEGGVAEDIATRLEHHEHNKQLNGTEMDPEVKRQIKRSRKRARAFTPLLKYGAAEFSVWASRMAMQILGGYGYVQEYAPERLLRDALVLPVYEGTSQIQALMVLKDTLGGITKNPQKFLRKLGTAKLNVMATDPMERSFHRMQADSYSAQQHILWRVAKGKFSTALQGPITEAFDNITSNWDPKRDFIHGQLHAERLTKILLDVAIGKILLKQARKFPERRIVAEKWMERAEPRVRYNFDLIQNTGGRLLDELNTDAEAETQKESATQIAQEGDIP